MLNPKDYAQHARIKPLSRLWSNAGNSFNLGSLIPKSLELFREKSTLAFRISGSRRKSWSLEVNHCPSGKSWKIESGIFSLSLANASLRCEEGSEKRKDVKEEYINNTRTAFSANKTNLIIVVRWSNIKQTWKRKKNRSLKYSTECDQAFRILELHYMATVGKVLVYIIAYRWRYKIW